MTNVRRPIHLQLRPSTAASFASLTPTTTPATCSQKALSPTGDSLPSQILPHLFVGNQEQTNRETLNRLNISYILSLGLLPLISNSASPTSPTPNVTTSSQNHIHPNKHNNNNNHSSSQTKHNQHNAIQQQHILLPSQNSSKDFKIRLRTSSSTLTTTTTVTSATTGTNQNSIVDSTTTTTTPATTISNKSKQHQQQQQVASNRDENKGIKSVRSIHCKCINISDNSDQSLSKFFDEAHQFIDEARRKKCNILVHCLAGISRSPTIAIAYLMRVNSLRLQDAYNLVKQCRPQIDPNLSFMGQLMIYEKSLDNDRINNNNVHNQKISPSNELTNHHQTNITQSLSGVATTTTTI